MGVSNKNKYCENVKVNREDNCKHKNIESYPSSTLQGLRPVSLQNPARSFTSTKKPGTPDYFLSGQSLSNPKFHSPKDSYLVVLIRCWDTNPILTAQGTDASF